MKHVDTLVTSGGTAACDMRTTASNGFENGFGIDANGAPFRVAQQVDI